MPAKPSDDAIAIALMLHLDMTLIGLVRFRHLLGDDPIESGAFKAAKPIRRYSRLVGCRGQVDRRRSRIQERVQRLPPAFKGLRRRKSQSPTQSTSKNTIDAGVFCQHLHPRRSRIDAELECLKAPGLFGRDHDFAIEDTADRNRCQGFDQLKEIAVERFLSLLCIRISSPSRKTRAQTRPTSVKTQYGLRVIFADSLREHRQDWRIHRKMHAPCYRLPGENGRVEDVFAALGFDGKQLVAMGRNGEPRVLDRGQIVQVSYELNPPGVRVDGQNVSVSSRIVRNRKINQTIRDGKVVEYGRCSSGMKDFFRCAIQ